MTFVEQIRTITEGLGWYFHYGRRDFQNLVRTNGADDQTIYFFLDPVTRVPEYSSDSGFKTGAITYTGRFLIVTKSKLDEVYDTQKNQDVTNGKWRKHIEPKLRQHFGELENAIICEDDLQIVSISILDAINVFSENVDGVLVNYNIKRV